MKTNSIFYKKQQTTNQLLYSQGLQTSYNSMARSENHFKKIKLSLSEIDFLKIREKKINLDMIEELPNGLDSQIRPYNHVENQNGGITFHANEFKLFKAPNSQAQDISQNQHTSIPIGQYQFFQLKGKARLGDKENPIIAEDGYKEESKSDIADKEAESNLLDELDKVTKNISIISFDGLGSPIASEKGKILTKQSIIFQNLMKKLSSAALKKRC